MRRAEPRIASTPTSDAGFVAGLDALAFGVLIFVIGTLIVLNGWTVIDAKYASNAAAREAVRAVVEAPAGTPSSELQQRATSAARQAYAAHGHEPGRVDVTAEGPLTLERCSEVSIVTTVEVTSVIVPGLMDTPRWHVSSRYQQVVDPFRSGLEVEGWDGCGF